MTIPYERYTAIKNTERFLVELMDPKKTPKVPKYVRERAYRCLRHYPGEYYMEMAQQQAPDVFGEFNESTNR